VRWEAEEDWGARWISGDAAMNTLHSIVAGVTMSTLPAEAQDHRFETDPVATSSAAAIRSRRSVDCVGCISIIDPPHFALRSAGAVGAQTRAARHSIIGQVNHCK
jgi:hypothetical protein